MSETAEILRKAARQPFFSFFMDGRNEHGTHLLYIPPCGISSEFETEICETVDEQSDKWAERIFKEAEALGFETGNCITTVWRHDPDGYWEYERVSPALTALFFGNAREQKDAIALSKANGVGA